MRAHRPLPFRLSSLLTALHVCGVVIWRAMNVLTLATVTLSLPALAAIVSIIRIALRPFPDESLDG